MLTTLIGVETIGIAAVIDRGTSRERDVCLGGAAIVAERREHGVHVIASRAKAAGVVRRQIGLRVVQGRSQIAITPDQAVHDDDVESEALDQWTAQSRPYDQVRTLNGLSLALVEAGNDVEARAAYERALKIIDTLDAQLDAEQMKTSFLNSTLVRDIKKRRDSL